MSKTFEKEVRADRNYRVAALMAVILTIALMGVSSEWLPLWGLGCIFVFGVVFAALLSSWRDLPRWGVVRSHEARNGK